VSSHLKVCFCGRRGLPGTNRCALHPAPVITEAERLIRHPYRIQYGSSAYRRNRARALERAGGQCEACHEPHGPKKEVDHTIPVRDGGSDDLVNLEVLCPTCVRLKNRADKAGRHK